jgi:hypothetical protein
VIKFIVEHLEIFAYFGGMLQGAFVSYLWFAPDTKFKQSVIDGLIFKFIWGRFVKKEVEEDPYEMLLPKKSLNRKVR